MRLQRALARAGVASRRAAEDLIEAGNVRINGVVATLGVSADPERDTITVRGRPVRAAPIKWIALHKPVGHIVTRRDRKGRPTVFDLVPDLPGLTYVGRLDVLTSGLLLLTSDGAAVHRLTHPRFGVEREYRVVVRGHPPDEIRRALGEPIVVDGRAAMVARFGVRPGGRGTSTVTLVVTEGRNRLVRRVCEQLGLTVERLVRVSHGPISLGRLASGRWRYLTAREVRLLGAGGIERGNRRVHGSRT